MDAGIDSDPHEESPRVYRGLEELRLSRLDSPHDLEPFVKLEGFVRRHDRHPFRERLGDDVAVEGIRVTCGQIE